MKYSAIFFMILILPLRLAADDWIFTDVSDATNAAHLHSHFQGILDEELSIGAGVAAGDYDNDGDVDLYLVTGNNAANVLLRNNNGT